MYTKTKHTRMRLNLIYNVTMDKTQTLSPYYGIWFALDSPLTYDVLLGEQKFCLSPRLSDHPNPTHSLLGILG